MTGKEYADKEYKDLNEGLKEIIAKAFKAGKNSICTVEDCPVLAINMQNMQKVAELEAQIEEMKEDFIELSGDRYDKEMCLKILKKWEKVEMTKEELAERNMTKEEQKAYTESISKVYKPTGAKLFEKEAKEYREEWQNKGYYFVSQEMEQIELDDIVDATFKDGAEFGYNKANEWHYVKDGNPNNENDILCQISKDEVVVGYYRTVAKRYFTIDGQDLYNVIAWKEIVLPELPKESE